jgi:hypothetical protein
MAKFSDAFLQGLRGSGQRGSPTDPALQRADQYGSSNPLAKSIGGMFGMQMDTGQELAAKEMKQIADPTSSEGLLQSLAVQAKYEQDPKRQIAIVAQMGELRKTAALESQAKEKEATLRTALMAEAKKQGNTKVVNWLIAGGDLKAAGDLLMKDGGKAEAYATMYTPDGKAYRTAVINGNLMVATTDGKGWTAAPEDLSATDPNSDSGTKTRKKASLSESALDTYDAIYAKFPNLIPQEKGFGWRDYVPYISTTTPLKDVQRIQTDLAEDIYQNATGEGEDRAWALKQAYARMQDPSQVESILAQIGRGSASTPPPSTPQTPAEKQRARAASRFPNVNSATGGVK